jgi:hypothetical protein
MNYKQCCLMKNDKKLQVAWIPEKYAIIDKILKLKVNNTWQNGWKVYAVYNSTKTEESLEKHEQVYRDFKITLGE